MNRKGYTKNIPVKNIGFMKINNEGIYSYLQSLSFADNENGNYYTLVEKDRVSTTCIADVFKLNRSTVTRNLNQLRKIGVLNDVEIEGRGYYQLWCTEMFAVIDIELLNYLIKHFRTDLIKVFVYLSWRDEQAERRNAHYYFTKGELIEQALGLTSRYAKEQQSNLIKIEEILKILSDLNLISVKSINVATNKINAVGDCIITKRFRLQDVTKKYIEVDRRL